MADESTTGGWSPLAKVSIVVGVAGIASAILASTIQPPLFTHMGHGMGPGRVWGTYTDVRLFLSTFNVLLLLALTWSYLRVYQDLPNRFTLSLMLFSIALLLYALSSNPAVHLLFGFRGGTGLGPFAFLPDLFAAFAVTVLLYQSYQ